MRLTIVKDDDLIIKDGVPYFVDLSSKFNDMSWIPDYDLKIWGKFHALQWYGDPNEDGEYGFGKDEPHGEVEFKKSVPNLIIKELGIFEEALSLWESASIIEKERIETEEKNRQLYLLEEEEELRKTYIDFDLETLLSEI